MQTPSSFSDYDNLEQTDGNLNNKYQNNSNYLPFPSSLATFSQSDYSHIIQGSQSTDEGQNVIPYIRFNAQTRTKGGKQGINNSKRDNSNANTKVSAVQKGIGYQGMLRIHELENQLALYEQEIADQKNTIRDLLRAVHLAEKMTRSTQKEVGDAPRTIAALQQELRASRTEARAQHTSLVETQRLLRSSDRRNAALEDTLKKKNTQLKSVSAVLMAECADKTRAEEILAALLGSDYAAVVREHENKADEASLLPSLTPPQQRMQTVSEQKEKEMAAMVAKMNGILQKKERRIEQLQRSQQSLTLRCAAQETKINSLTRNIAQKEKEIRLLSIQLSTSSQTPNTHTLQSTLENTEDSSHSHTQTVRTHNTSALSLLSTPRNIPNIHTPHSTAAHTDEFVLSFLYFSFYS